MKKHLTWKETVTITSMLFGMFFGAGNLIFPAYMGQMAGRNMWIAILGFLVTGVGLPLLGVAALGISRCEGLTELSRKVGKGYGTFFTCALYLTIGPFFAIPRCATVPFEIGMVPILPKYMDRSLALAVFTAVFFLAVLWFSLRPGKILFWVGKMLNPIFLLILGVLLLTALLNPIAGIDQIAPQGGYADSAFFTGFLEGYHTMDALAGLAFGIVVVRVIRDLGITEPGAVAVNTIYAGVFSCALMGVIYLAVTMVGAQSRGAYEPCSNGGEVLSLVSSHYFGKVGIVILFAAVLMACLKTAVGLITSCGETFQTLFPGVCTYRTWAVVFCAVSFMIANAGLNMIIAYSVPVLVFLYPLSITLIALTLLGRLWNHDPKVSKVVTGVTLLCAIPDLFKALPKGISGLPPISALVTGAERVLPFFSIGLGWFCPALISLAVVLIWRKYFNKG